MLCGELSTKTKIGGKNSREQQTGAIIVLKYKKHTHTECNGYTGIPVEGSMCDGTECATQIKL